MKERNAKGQGSFWVNENGTVTHRKSVGYKSNGNRKILTVTASSKAACIKLMREKETAWKKCQVASLLTEGKTVVDLCEAHSAYQSNAGELKFKSIDRRETTIKQIGEYEFGHMQLSAITVVEVDVFFSALITEGKYASSSLLKMLDVLNASFRWAMLRGDVTHNPVEPIKRTIKKRIQKLDSKSSTESDVDVLSEEERRKFEETARELWNNGTAKYPSGLYILLLLHSGMRAGESLALKWKNIDFSNRTIDISKSRSMIKNRSGNIDEKKYVMHLGTVKNEKARKIEMTDAALQDLKAIYASRKNPNPDDLIFITRTGAPHTTTSLEHRAKTIYHNAGLTHLRGGLHILRRTFATEMYEKGARVADIAAYIGDLESTTQRYYIAIRKKRNIDGKEEHIVALPKIN